MIFIPVLIGIESFNYLTREVNIIKDLKIKLIFTLNTITYKETEISNNLKLNGVYMFVLVL